VLLVQQDFNMIRLLILALQQNAKATIFGIKLFKSVDAPMIIQLIWDVNALLVLNHLYGTHFRMLVSPDAMKLTFGTQ
jgi:hypothetical protein